MEDYKTYLVENVLSDDKVVSHLPDHKLMPYGTGSEKCKFATNNGLKIKVTYRLLSRALRVHPNVAKQ